MLNETITNTIGYYHLGTRGNYDVSKSSSGELDDLGMLMRNTKENEYVSLKLIYCYFSNNITKYILNFCCRYVNVYRKSIFQDRISPKAEDEGSINVRSNGKRKLCTDIRGLYKSNKK